MTAFGPVLAALSTIQGAISAWQPEFALLLAFTALVPPFVVAIRDYRTFEIHFETLAVGAVLAAALVALVGGSAGLVGSVLVAAGTGGAAAIIAKLRPARIGCGDIWLLAYVGLVAGLEHVAAVFGTFALLAVALSAIWSVNRGKRLFKSAIPAGLPAFGAAAVGMVLHALTAFERYGNPGPAFLEEIGALDELDMDSAFAMAAALAALAALLATCVGLAVVAVVSADRRSGSAAIASSAPASPERDQ